MSIRKSIASRGCGRVRGVVVGLGFLLASLVVSIPVKAGDVLFVDTFESHTPGTVPGLPWTEISGGGEGISALVWGYGDPFSKAGANQYLEFRGETTAGPLALRSMGGLPGGEAAEVITLSFLMIEPDLEGQRDWISLFLYVGPRATENRAQRFLLGRGQFAGIPYAYDDVLRVDAVINNSEDPVSYDGREGMLPPGTFDLWLNGELAAAGLARDHERKGGITGIELAKATNNTPLVLFDDFTVFSGAVPNRPIPPPYIGDEFHVSSPSEIVAVMRDHAQPGDTLIMANGEWRNVTITFEGHGSEERPITLRAETPGQVILCGQSRLRIGGSHLVVDGLLFTDGWLTSGSVVEFRTSAMGHARDSRLTNTGFVRYNSPDRTNNYKWVSLFGRRNRVDHCRFDGMDHVGQAITVWLDGEPNYHRIDHNFFGPRPPLGMNGGEMIRIGDSGTSLQNSRTVVEHNLFFECDGEGEIVSNKSCENIFRHNTFIRSAGALTLRHGHRNLVEGNYFFGGFKPGTGGVRIINEGQVVINNYFHGLTGRGFSPPLGIMNGKPDSELHEYFQVKDAVVAFNTFVDCERPVIIGLGAERSDLTLPPENLVMANNIFTATVGPIIEMRDQPVSVTWTANLVFGASVGIPQTPGVTQANPMFEEGFAGLFLPGPGSPAIGGAEGDFSWVEHDILGRLRSGDTDIGAVEISELPVRTPPLTPGDVGPEWMRSGWESWRSEHFNPADWADPTTIGAWAARGPDSVPNILRFVLGISPDTPISSYLPEMRLTDGQPEFIYRRAADISGAAVTVEISPDLQEWYWGEGYTSVTRVAHYTNYHLVSVEPADPAAEKMFMRLRVREE